MKIDICDICRERIDLYAIRVRAKKLEPGGLMECGYWTSIDICHACCMEIARRVNETKRCKEVARG